MLASRAARLGRLMLIAAVLMAPWVAATAQQDVGRETRSVEAFTELSFSVPGTVYLRQGEPQSVEVEAPQKVLDRLETEVDGDELEIRSEGKGNWFSWFGGDGFDGEVKVYVTVPTLSEISIAGSGRIVGETPIEGASLEVQNAGSGEVDLTVQNDEMEVNIAGSGTIRLRGTSGSFEASIAGSGDIEAVELETATAEVSIAGSGDVRLHVTDRLEASIMGSGDVQYRGSPELETSSMGSGDVEPIEQE
jgi:hypothetical protein